MKYYICPECEEKLEYVKFTRDCTEYGTYDLPSEPEIGDTDRVYDGDYNTDDSEGGDEYFTCPECEANIQLRNLVIINEEAEAKAEAEKTGKPIKKKKIDETKIIKPNDGLYTDRFNPWDQHDRIPDYAKCNKCNKEILLTREEIQSEEPINCPKCDTQLIKQKNEERI